MHASRLDYVLNFAEKEGIAIQFCFNSGYPLIDHEGCGGWSGYHEEDGNILIKPWHNPFNQFYGGPCSSPLDYFDINNKRNIKLQRDIIRYTVARWGYSTSIFSWELFNEVNQVDIGYFKMENGKPIAEYKVFKNNSAWIYPDIVEWHEYIYDYIKSIDPIHLITTSLAYLDEGGTVEQYNQIFNKMDIVQAHMYGGFINKYATDPEWNFQKYILGTLPLNPHSHSINRHLKEFPNKPFLPGEYGIESLIKDWGNGIIYEGTGYRIQNPKEPQFWMNFDPNGYELHNNLWLSVFSGCSGTIMEWHNNYIDDRIDKTKYKDYSHTELYDRYRPIGNFIKNYPGLNDSYIPSFKSEDKFNAYYLSSCDQNVYSGWVQSHLFEGNNLFNYDDFPDKNRYIYTLTDGKPVFSVNNSFLTIPVYKFGTYRVKWHSSYDDFNIIDEQLILSCDGSIKIKIPESIKKSPFGDAIFYAIFDCEKPYWFDSGFSDKFESIHNISADIVPWADKLFYRSTDNKLREVFYDGSNWVNSGINSYFENHPYIGGDLVVWGSKLFYRSTENTLRKVYHDEFGWHDSGLNEYFENHPNIGGDLVVWGSKLFYRSTENTLREVYHDEFGWHDSGLNEYFENHDNIGGDLVVWGSKLFYRSTENTLREVYHDEFGWHDSGLNEYFENYDNIGGDLVIWDNKLYYRSTTNKLREVYHDELGWHDSGLNDYFESNPIIGGDLVVWDNKLFYRSTYNTLREVYFDESGWHDSGLSCSIEQIQHVKGGLVPWDNKMIYQSSMFTLRNISFGSECYKSSLKNTSDGKEKIKEGDILNLSKSNNKDRNVNVFPNPATSVLYIEGAPKDVKIYNSMGQKMIFILGTSSSSSMLTINIEDWPNGLYIVFTEFGFKKILKQS